MTDVSIIIVNYRTSGLMLDAIDSVLEKTEGVSFEVIVIDNNSDDGSRKAVEEHFGDRIVYRALPENVGFGRANNAGMEIASGRNILFLNPDTILMNNAVRIMSDFLDANPRVGAVGGNLYSTDGAPNASFGRTLPGLFDETDRVFLRLFSRIAFGKNILFNYTEKPIEVGYICGADLMIPRRIIAQVGGYDPDFFMYYEETELQWRIKGSGYRVVSLPSARIIHLEGKSFTANFDRELRMFTSRKIYYNKAHSRLYWMAADANYTFFTWLGFILGSLSGRKAFKAKTAQRLKVLSEVRKNPPPVE